MPKKKAESEVKGIAQVDKTVLKSLALGGLLGGGGECVVDVKDGKAVRIRPLHYDWKYDRKDLNAWKITRNGQTLEPLMKTSVVPPKAFGWCFQNEILYPPEGNETDCHV